MDNPAPSQPKWRLRRPRKPGDLAALQRSLWWAILQAEAVLAGDETTVEQILVANSSSAAVHPSRQGRGGR
jgi:hypothetical protein